MVPFALNEIDPKIYPILLIAEESKGKVYLYTNNLQKLQCIYTPGAGASK